MGGKKLYIKEKKGNEEIKRIRKELGITQAELAFPGMSRSVIAALESGEKSLNPKQASMLAVRFQEFGYLVSAKVLMGQDKDVEEILKPIQESITEDKLEELDDAILKTNNDKAIEIILCIIKILKKDMYAYANLILKYILKINEFKLKKEDYIQINIDLMAVYIILERYEDVLIISSAIKIHENGFDKKSSAAYYFNIANAYYYLKEYELSKKFLNKAKKFNQHSIELHILTVEGNIFTMRKKNKEAIEINKTVIRKAKKINSKLHVANALSNISYMLAEQNKLEEAQKYIEEALEYYNDIEIYYKFNIINNKFYLELKKDNATFESFKQLILLAAKARDIDRMNENIILYISYCIKNKETKEFLIGILKFLDKNSIKLESDVKIKLIKCIQGSYSLEDILEKIIGK